MPCGGEGGEGGEGTAHWGLIRCYGTGSPSVKHRLQRRHKLGVLGAEGIGIVDAFVLCRLLTQPRLYSVLTRSIPFRHKLGVLSAESVAL